jgi:hypothetical protein
MSFVAFVKGFRAYRTSRPLIGTPAGSFTKQLKKDGKPYPERVASMEVGWRRSLVREKEGGGLSRCGFGDLNTVKDSQTSCTTLSPRLRKAAWERVQRADHKATLSPKVVGC